MRLSLIKRKRWPFQSMIAKVLQRLLRKILPAATSMAERAGDKPLPRRRPHYLSPFARSLPSTWSPWSAGFWASFLDDYEKVSSLRARKHADSKAIIIASALGESAVIGSGFIQALDPEAASALIRRLVEPTNLRAGSIAAMVTWLPTAGY